MQPWTNKSAKMKTGAHARFFIMIYGVLLSILSHVDGIATETAPSNTLIILDTSLIRSTGGISQFDRRKYITLHTDVTENDWNSPQSASMMDTVFRDLDIYFGRNNGGMVWWANQLPEDPQRPGYIQPLAISEQGQIARLNYASDLRNRFDARADTMIGGQPQVMWPELKANWDWAGATAVGEYMARYVNKFYRPFSDSTVSSGAPAPRFIEIMNEPLYSLCDDPLPGLSKRVTPLDVFEYHRDAAKAFKFINTNTQIGGFTVAFPEFDLQNFDRWDQRMKLFMDTAGAEMDFFSLHFYDFNHHWAAPDRGYVHFKGSRLEATLDMVETYSHQLWGQVKPLVISEYGGRDHTTERDTWSPQRDWVFMKALTPMLMTFMDRPDRIEKTIPFIVTSFDWAGDPPYPWRLLRFSNEPESLSGDRVFTEMIKFYELWKEVKGTRLDTYSTNPDVKADAYTFGKKAWLILSNLSLEKQPVFINIQNSGESTSAEITEIQIRHLHAVNRIPQLTIEQDTQISEFMLDPEAAAVIELTYSRELNPTHQAETIKYYSDQIKQSIQESKASVFTFSNVDINQAVEAVLDLSFGRAHPFSKHPVVTFNGNILNVPHQFAGDDLQSGRSSFFGQLNIPFPVSILQATNTVSIQFPDSGGFVSSVCMRVTSSDQVPVRPDQVRNIRIYPEQASLGVNQQRQLTASLSPENARDIRVNWSSSDPSIVSVDRLGQITGQAIGSATITVTSVESNHSVKSSIQVIAERVPVLADTVLVEPSKLEMIRGETAVLSASILPIDTDNRSITWSSQNPQVATVDSTGKIVAVADGSTQITATATGGAWGVCEITSQTRIPGSITFDDKSKYLQTIYKVGSTLPVTCSFRATTGRKVDEKGLKFWLRELRSNWSVVKDRVVYDPSTADKNTGIASASISLKDLTPSTALPAGNFYYLWVTFTEDNGTQITQGAAASPITIVSDE